jgi:hypothetical protein
MFRLVQKAGECLVVGLSSETKPSPTLNHGFLELNTGKFWLGNGNAWVEQTNTAYSTFDGTYANLSGAPTTFPPASHSHPQSDVTNLVSALAGKAASSHTHAPSDITGTAVITTDPRLSDARTPTTLISASPSLGVGYGAGAGGTVSQLTSKATGVTLSKVTGKITTHNAALAANTTVSFTLTNTAIGPDDVLVLNHISGGTGGSYALNAQCANGSAVINLRNITAGSLSQAIVIAFTVIKGAVA